MDAVPRDGTSSNANGVLDPGEFVVVESTWGGYGYGHPVPTVVHGVTGSLASFTGPGGLTYSIGDASATYGDIYDMGWTSCNDGSPNACYTVSVEAPAVRPALHWDAIAQEDLNTGQQQPWTVHIGESFSDVPRDDHFYRFIETLLHNGVTAGCFGGAYCPGIPVTRAQMAVLLLKAKLGFAYTPRVCTGAVFADVSCARVFDPWIEDLATRGITEGCGSGFYCPGNSVTREQMAVFLLKALEGPDYWPPECSGVFADVSCSPGEGFSEWIEELARRGITGGCGVSPALYCPTSPVTRGQMAALLTKTFGLLLYGGH